MFILLKFPTRPLEYTLSNPLVGLLTKSTSLKLRLPKSPIDKFTLKEGEELTFLSPKPTHVTWLVRELA